MQSNLIEEEKVVSENEVKRILVWAVARSRSTAFQRAFEQRNDTKSYFESFQGVITNQGDDTYQSVFDRLLAPCEVPFLLTKELSYYIPP